jgi:hypothetical protein
MRHQDQRSVFGLGGARDAQDQRDRSKDDITEVDRSGFVPVEQDRTHAAAYEPNGAQQNENEHRNPPRTLKAMSTLWPSEKFTPRASGPSINGNVRLRGHTSSMPRRLRILSAGDAGTDILSAVEDRQEQKDAGRERDYNQQEACDAADRILAHAAVSTPFRDRGRGAKHQICRFRRAIVLSLPGSWFTRAIEPLLTAYCRHLATSDRLAKLGEVAATADDPDHLKHWDKLLANERTRVKGCPIARTCHAIDSTGTIASKNRRPRDPDSGPKLWDRKPWEDC